MSAAFDRIFASAPLNGTVGAVTSRGPSYTPSFSSPRRYWEEPPESRPAPASYDLTGMQKGRLTVIGLLKDYNPAKGAPWIVRCVCGIYETRKAKALCNPANAEDRCQFCDHTRRLQKLGSKQRSVESFVADLRSQP